MNPSPSDDNNSFDARRPSGWRALLPPMSAIGFAVAVVAVLLVTLFSYRSHESRAAAVEASSQALESMQRLQQLMSSLKDAETGQRGYLLTGTEQYLRPYEAAVAQVPAQLARVRERSGQDAANGPLLDELGTTIDQKLQELRETVALRRAGRADEAMALVRTDQGKELMERIRALAARLEEGERALFERRRAAWDDAVMTSLYVTWGGASLLLVLIAAGAVMTSRDYRARATEAWLRAGHAGTSLRVQGDLRLDRLGQQVTSHLAQYLDAQAGAMYVLHGDGRFRRVGSYGSAEASAPEWLHAGEGLLGQVAHDRVPLHVRDVPAGYMPVSSSSGRAAPRELLLAPASVDGVVQCVVEFGFFRRVGALEAELLQRVGETLAMATRASKDRTRVEELLEETQRQAEELQAQQEELRVSNEELEEQGRALRESSARLENQQAELEQSNAQLEEQAQSLERQKDALSQAQEALAERAAELERANQYKSEFLANMSHELRTPLNSTLILAKLLADNKQENLSEDQVRYAQTIASAGRDLLVLINDILDLSKIEAGKVEMQIDELPLQRIVDTLAATFEPVARERGLAFAATVEPGAPAVLRTDESRCGQILKNLLSNAFKFTERGQVALRVAAAPEGGVSFAVSDTGIGIAGHQLEIIFEAFRQADGSTHRKYGGTGLGLSISRDLARLLGGDLQVSSTLGQGSVFTLTLPREAPAAAAPPPPPSPPPAPEAVLPPPPLLPAAEPQPAAQPLADDRDALTPGTRSILVVEDDLHFAAILRDLVREQGFLCLLTHTASAGLAAAQRWQPSAILLDMKLPDHSGMGVLDQLKSDARTRHIPVHVVSVSNFAHEALERGAVGYAFKPVQREQVVAALQSLEARFTAGTRRVLVVEDDPRQRESVRELLAAEDVQIVAAESAEQALRELQASTFDCMVLDLNLPDLSGYELLEQMSQRDGVSFPPVIIYTGRSLTADQEQRLRRYSRSIIIKDARSPERLLDEVTLFLHQVESRLPAERQRMLKVARSREAALEGRRVLVVEDDVRNIFALSAVLEPKGVKVEIARNGREALDALARSLQPGADKLDLVLMDVMMPEMDGLTAMREIRKQPAFAKLPIIALTAKAMPDDQERCLNAGANDYIAKPLDVEKLLSLVRVWIPK